MTFRIVSCLTVGFGYPNTGMDLPDTVLDSEQKRDLFRSVLPPEVEVVWQRDRGKSEYRNDLLSCVEVPQAHDEVALIYDSGHGTRVRGGDEEDGWNEAIVTMPKPGEAGIQIIDDELARIFARCRGQVVYLSDRCFSGGFSRAAFARDLFFGNTRLPRFYPTDVPEPGEKVWFASKLSGTAWGLLASASAEGEVSYSTGQGGAWSLAWNAAFARDLSLREINRALKAKFDTASYPQHPKLVGKLALKTARLFG